MAQIPNNPHKNDLFFTPQNIAQQILDHFKPTGKLLDPCMGHGVFYDNFPSDNKDWCEIDKGKDFFEYNEKVDWIISNPPFSKFTAFLEHSVKLADNIVFLIYINSLFTKKRVRTYIDNGFELKEMLMINEKPEGWPSCGLQLGAIHLRRR
jgi:hypothetical protein